MIDAALHCEEHTRATPAVTMIAALRLFILKLSLFLLFARLHGHYLGGSITMTWYSSSNTTTRPLLNSTSLVVVLAVAVSEGNRRVNR